MRINARTMGHALRSQGATATRRIISVAAAGALATAGVAALPAPNANAADCEDSGFCVDVYNGLSTGVHMQGDSGTGWYWVRPGLWSDDATNGQLQDVDWVEVPSGCTITYLGTTYRQFERVRIRGISPYVWLVGNC